MSSLLQSGSRTRLGLGKSTLATLTAPNDGTYCKTVRRSDTKASGALEGINTSNLDVGKPPPS